MDEGKALRDGSDQKKIVKVIQEQGRAIREGSVIPDLSSERFQALPRRPVLPPPVPLWPGAEKRNADDAIEDARPQKRRRLEQIEEGREDVMQSIEGRRSPSVFDLRGAHFLSDINRGMIENFAPKNESPLNSREWMNRTPATRDELEELPGQPEAWQSGRPRIAPANHRNGDREQGRQNQTVNGMRTPGTVSMLNGMKSASPSARKSGSSSANKFKRARRNMYDMPESDIDDSQISPESRPRTVFTPKLVQKGTNEGGETATTSRSREASRLDGESLNTKKQSGHQLPCRTTSKTHPRTQSQSSDEDEQNVQRQRKSNTQRHSTEVTTTSRSTGVASVTSRRNEQARKRVKPTKIGEAGEVLDQDEEGTTDSVSAQMQDELVRHSSPGKQKARSSTKAATTDWSRNTSEVTHQHNEDVERSPESVSDVEEPAPKPAPKTPRSAVKTGTRGGRLSAAALKCWTCWNKSARCDNEQPKCAYCAKYGKNCQIYAMTKAEYEQEKADRQAGRSAAPKQSRQSVAPRVKSSKQKPATRQLSEEVIAATDESDASEEEEPEVKVSKQRAKPATKLVTKASSAKNVVKKAAQTRPISPEEEDDEESGEEETDAENEAEAARGPEQTDGPADDSRKLADAAASSESRASSTSSAPSETSKQQNETESDRETSVSEDESVPQKFPEVSPKLAAARNTNEAYQATKAHDEDTLSKEQANDTGDTSSQTKPVPATKKQELEASQTKTQHPSTPSNASQNKTDQAVEKSAASSTRILLGMTEQEYEASIKRNANLTDEQRKANKLALRKFEKGRGRTSTPLVPRSQSSQTGEQTNLPKHKTPSIRSAEKGPSSTQGSVKNIPATQPIRSAPIVNVAATPQPPTVAPPNSAPPKAQQPVQPVQPTATSKLKLLPNHPTKATTAAAMGSDQHQNPPYKKPGRTSLPATAASGGLGAPRTIQELKARLAGQNSGGSGSGASTPQSANKVAQVSSVPRNGVQKKGFSIPGESDDDEDDDDDDESDEDDDEEEEKQNVVKKRVAKPPVVNSNVAKEVGTKMDEEPGSETDDESTDAE